MVYSDEFKMEKSECTFVNQHMNDLLNVHPIKAALELQSGGGGGSEYNGVKLDQYKEALS
jgi:hypothetical protein